MCAAAASRMPDEQRAIRYFLYEHMHEESGHEEWVLNDLEASGSRALERCKLIGPIVFDRDACAATTTGAADRRHPCSVLGMMYALEVIASVYGGPFASAISESLLLEGDRGMSFISSHATHGHRSTWSDLRLHPEHRRETRRRRTQSSSRRSSTSTISPGSSRPYERAPAERTLVTELLARPYRYIRLEWSSDLWRLRVRTCVKPIQCYSLAGDGRAAACPRRHHGPAGSRAPSS